MHKVIGIDLGTTYSAVAAYDPETEESVFLRDDDDASGITPSVVGMNAGKAIVGWLAKSNAPADPRNTITEIKRQMGELFTPGSLDTFNARAQFHEGDPVRVFFNGMWMLPQEISALILMRMKATAELKLGEEIRDAVITVPAYFTANQKKATEDAALLAGLYPRQLIPEPTAAAICYGLDKMDPDPKTYLVYDLGGGTFDVSIIRVQGKDIQVVATSGDHHLGGADFDEAITYWALEEATKQGVNVGANPIARAMVKYAAEGTKKMLSAGMTAKLVVIDPASNRSVGLELDRPTFERLIEEPLQRSLNSVALAIQYAEERGLARSAIDNVLLVGGSTRIPKVRQLLLDYFNRDETFVKADGHPDLLVARGAALLAADFPPSPPPFDIKRRPSATLVNPEAENLMNVNLITEHSLGVGVQDDRVDRLIERGTNIPVTKNKVYTNPEGASNLSVPVYQGEGSYAQDNTQIGELRLGPMQPLPAGQHQFDVSFALDRNGLLTVTVNHVNENRIYTANVDHKTAVGGDDALNTLRQRLLSMFSVVKAADIIVPPPPPPPPAITAPTAAQPQEVPTPGSGPSPATSPATQQATNGAGDALPEGLLLEFTREVEDEYKGILRRSRKQLLRNIDTELVKAYNSFAKAVNDGRPADEIEELGDELGDAYDDARRSS